MKALSGVGAEPLASIIALGGDEEVRLCAWQSAVSILAAAPEFSPALRNSRIRDYSHFIPNLSKRRGHDTEVRGSNHKTGFLGQVKTLAVKTEETANPKGQSSG